ncbi:MAG: hypothetical protein ACKN9V_03775 [Pseudomonadota bacterium]
MRLIKVFLTAILFIAAQSPALDYSDMEVIFRASETPQAEKLIGTWVGRCVHHADPYRLWPAFFQFKRLENKGKGFGSYSQSHTWFNEQTEKYDNYSMADLDQDPQCQQWLGHEPWNAVFYEEGSLVNTHQYPNTVAVRATRLYRDGNREHIVIAYSQGSKLSDFPASFCFFNVRLENKQIKE